MIVMQNCLWSTALSRHLPVTLSSRFSVLALTDFLKATQNLVLLILVVNVVVL